MMFDLCAMFVMLLGLLVAIREWRILDRELSMHRRTVRVKHNPPNTSWYGGGCKCIWLAPVRRHPPAPLFKLIRHPMLLYAVAFTFWYVPAQCLCRTTTRAPSVFCSRSQLNINIRGSNMTHRVVRVIDTVASVVFWSTVVMTICYSAYSKRMRSKRNWFASACLTL